VVAVVAGTTPSTARPRAAVVGHVEWVEFATVDHVPAPGEIVIATGPPFACAAGGGAVAAVQLARLGAETWFFTSVGADRLGARAADELRAHGIAHLCAAVHPIAQRRAFTHLDAGHERTITLVGEAHAPLGADALPWGELGGCGAVYFASGDAAALRAARAARTLVATPRAGAVLAAAGVPVDVLVSSARDRDERVPDLDPPPRYVVRTDGERGGTWTGRDGTSGRWEAVAPPSAPVDAYGCGDVFAAGLTYGLAAGLSLADALAIGARCGAACVAGRGPYGRMLTAAELGR
jgi:ribokinase